MNDAINLIMGFVAGVVFTLTATKHRWASADLLASHRRLMDENNRYYLRERAALSKTGETV